MSKDGHMRGLIGEPGHTERKIWHFVPVSIPTAAVNEEIIRSLTQRAEGPAVYPAKGGALE
jgi:hypothetical protein